MESIKYEIIKFLEREPASKSKVEDYMKLERGTTGDCVSRRLRELVAEGSIQKTEKEYQGKKYYEYRVVSLQSSVKLYEDDEISVHFEPFIEQTERLEL